MKTNMTITSSELASTFVWTRIASTSLKVLFLNLNCGKYMFLINTRRIVITNNNSMMLRSWEFYFLDFIACKDRPNILIFHKKNWRSRSGRPINVCFSILSFSETSHKKIVKFQFIYYETKADSKTFWLSNHIEFQAKNFFKQIVKPLYIIKVKF